MKKRLFKTTSSLVILCLMLLFVGCNNISKSLDEDIYIIEKFRSEIPAINDTLQKLVKFSSVELLVLRYSELTNYNIISIENRNLPVKIKHNFKIEKIGKKYLILEGKIKLKEVSTDTLSRRLITEGLITFTPKHEYIEDYPYMNFVFCKENIKVFSIFDNIIAARKQFEYINKKKLYNDSIFYPKCQIKDVKR